MNLYEGMSISLIFEIYSPKNYENLIYNKSKKYNIDIELITPEKFELILSNINDKKIIKNLIKEKPSLITQERKLIPKNYTYEVEYSNFVDFFIDNNENNLVETILFEIDLDIEIIENIIYSFGGFGKNKNLIYSILYQNKLELLKKINLKYNNKNPRPKCTRYFLNT